MKTEKEAIAILEEMILDEQRSKYPSVPEKARFVPDLKLKTANGLTKGVMLFINLSGGFAERTGNQGRFLLPTSYTNVFNKKVQLKAGKWIKGTGTNGTADVHGVFHGISLAIEIKIGRDTQSDAQKAYRKRFEAAGGVYIIAKVFGQFYNDFQERFKEKKAAI